MSATPQANLRGAMFMVLAMAAFSLEDMFYKSATGDMPAGQALMIFGALGLAIFVSLTVARGQRPVTGAMLGPGLLLRSGIELLGRVFFALALAYSDLSSTSAILQATPLVVALGAVVFFGESVGWRRWLAMAVGFAGVLIVLRPGTDAFSVGSIYAVLGMLGFAGRDLATRAAPPAVSNLQLGVLGFAVLTVAGGVIMLAFGESAVVPDATGLAKLGVAAIVGVTAYNAITVAMRTGEVSVVAPFRYTRLVFALILALVVFGEQPDLATLGGSVLIVGSGVFTLLRGARARA